MPETSTTERPLAVAGGTGFVGRRLVDALLRDGWDVRCLVRDADRARGQLPSAVDLAEIDLESGDGLRAALEGCGHAFFLVHMMGEDGEYSERERAAARVFAEAALAEGVDGVSYLGGLGGRSKHLRSRLQTADALAEHGPPLTSFRAAMVVGPGSESFELLRAIIRLLPVAPAPSWLDNLTQPIGTRDVIAYLRRSPEIASARGREVQIGCPEPLSHREVIERVAAEMGVGAPRWLPISDRIAKPEVMSAGAAALTGGNPLIAAELAFGLQEDTIVEDPSGAELFDVEPESIGAIIQRALIEEEFEMERAGRG